MNYPSANTVKAINGETPNKILQCLGVLENVSETTDFRLPCAQKVGYVINPALPLQLTVVSRNGTISWKGMVLSIYTGVEGQVYS